MFTDADLAPHKKEAPKVAFSAKRTKLPYPSVAPDGRTWEEYFREMRNERMSSEAEAEAEDEGEKITVTKPAEFVKSGWPRALTPWVKLLTTHGWQFAVGNAHATVAPVWYTDRSRGIRHPERKVETWWIDAVRGSIRVRMSWSYRGGKIDSARSGKTSNDKFGRYSDAEMKELITE